MAISHLTVEAREEVWPLKQPFRISRGSRTEAQVVVVTVSDGERIGYGECVPLARYNQSIASVLAQIELLPSEKDFNRETLQELMPAGAARNALDCALWDLEAKASGKRAWELANIVMVSEVETSFTISLDTPKKMAADATANSNMPILKLKLGGDHLDFTRVEAVHAATPAARLLIDANESWSPEHYRAIVQGLKELGVELIEQPF
ncbi:MAG: enolase C-terminal domain-like protein, partial [Candidatus Udaeobacter sp.]